MDDGLLLRKYADGQDAEAFAELVRRYAGMVYGTCLRITRNAHDAEDASQEAFLELARAAGSVQKPGPWLHRVAANKARNAVRDAATRNRHEAQVMPEIREGPTWEELAPHVDRAIEELPEELREVVVQHFLRGQTQAQVAETLGVNQSTVSRQLEQAVQQLREALRKGGVVASVAVLGTLLTQNASAAVPASLAAALGKIAVAGVGKASTGVATGTTASALGTAGGKAALAATALAVVIAAGVVVSQHAAKPPVPPLPIVNAAATNPVNGGMDVSQEKNPQPVVSKPDYSKLHLKGNVCVTDSFSAVVTAAAGLLGLDPDGDTVRALSGNPFAPGIRLTEPCSSWWHIQAQERCSGLVAAALGLTVVRLPEVDHSSDPAWPSDKTKEGAYMAAYWRKPYVPAVRQAMDRGSVVLAPREWDPSHYDNGWYGWGILVEAHEDGTLLGACMNGRQDNPMTAAANCWELSLAKESLSHGEADREMLRQAVHRIRGDAAPFLSDEHFVFGLAAMDAWIERMSTVAGFCKECQARGGRGWTDAKDNGVLLSNNSATAAAYLRRRLPSFPPEARPYIEATATCYDRISELLRPAITDEGYRPFIGDIAKQKAHAENVLVPIKAELAAAADAMDKALAQIDGPQMRDEKVALGGREYHLQWVSPHNLAALRLVGDNGIRSQAQYGDAANPLYNLHCGVRSDRPFAELEGELQRKFQRDGKAWGRYWQELAERLDVDYFALIAVADDRLAGHVRFLPADKGLLAMRHAESTGRKDVLLVSAGYVDVLGAKDGLDRELLRRMEDYARTRRFTAVRGLGWSDVRAFAMWAGTFPVTTFSAQGFKIIATQRADAGALEDMLAGHHGDWVKAQVTAAMASGMTKEKALELSVVELGLADGTVKRNAEEATPMTAKPDYSKLDLKGDDHSKDSFSLTLRAVARMYGIDVDYETVYGLSGNGFAPGIHPPEDCRQLQRTHDRGQCIDIVAARLGLVLRLMDLRNNPKPWPAIRDALDHGEVVIASRGWLDAPYTWWGIILEAPENGPVNAIRGATQNGRKDNRLDHAGKCWAVTLGKPTMTPEQADIVMLRRAVARIRGDREPFLLGDDQVVYGLKAMDLWIADMRKPAFQESDPASSMGNAASCALYTSEGARDTCSYLRRRLVSFPEAARADVAAAADQYDLIWRTLAPFAVYPGGYAGVIGNPDRQTEHADKVLTPCKDAMAKAAEHLEKALIAIGEIVPKKDR